MQNGYTYVPNDAIAVLVTLGGSALKTYVVLLSHRDPRTGRCAPANVTLAAETGMSRRHVRTVVRSLEDAGLVVTVPQTGSDGGTRPNGYRFPHVEDTRP